MARKETYRLRYTNKLVEAGEAPVKKERKERVPIDPVIQLPYAEGKVLLIDKPLHWTSFDVVRKMRSILQIKKIGHAGTLDPLATGLLIVCTGKFTKKINEYMAQEKEYTGQITLGATTPTYDLESEPAEIKDYSDITEEMVHAATTPFIGAIEQFPPIFSAIKKDGVALYELARRGVDVKLEARKITIHQFEITSIDLPVVAFKVVCSTGTYIRSLANDFGAALGCGGYLSGLRRTRIGEFNATDAMTMEQFEDSIPPSPKGELYGKLL
ncbi:MAG: tRNA pseudouridine(55) synthase TruB [Ferruginibacter sp.]